MPDSGIIRYLLDNLSAARAALLDQITAHFHNRARWLGARAGWTGADEVESASNDSIDPFVLISGDDTWGSPLCIIGSDDTPVIAGMVMFDPHLLSVQAAGDDAPIRIRLAWDTSYAAAIANGNFTEASLVAATKLPGGPYEVLCPRIASGTKIFGAIWAKDVNARSLSFTIGIHEYDE